MANADGMISDCRSAAEVAAKAGEILIRAGSETHRVEDTLVRIMSAHSDSSEALVFSTGFTLSACVEGKETVTLTRRVFGSVTDIGDICRVNSVSREFCSGRIDSAEALRRLSLIEERAGLPPVWSAVLTCIASGGFALVYGRDAYETAGAALCGAVLSLFSVFLSRIIRGDFLINVLGSAAATVLSVSIAFAYASFSGGYQLRIQYMIIGSIIPLLPGITVTNAVRDTLYGDYISATSRGLEALLSAVSIAVGVFLGLKLSAAGGAAANMNLSFISSPSTPFEIFMTSVAAGISAAAFAALLDVPAGYIPPCALCGAGVWAVYVLCLAWGLSEGSAVLSASAAADAVAWIMARHYRIPVTPFLISGVIALVPGIGLYKTVYFLFLGDTGAVYSSLEETMIAAGAIAVAVFAVDAGIASFKRIRAIIRSRRKQVSRGI